MSANGKTGSWSDVLLGKLLGIGEIGTVDGRVEFEGLLMFKPMLSVLEPGMPADFASALANALDFEWAFA